MRNKLVEMGCFAAIALTAPALAGAQTLYDWPSEQAPAVVHQDGTLFFVGKDKSVWRVYSWKASQGQNRTAAYFVDINQDGKPDIVGAGRPSFGLDHDANPLWFAGGCDQLLTADFGLDKKLDFVCLTGKTLEARTWDWQKIWSISIGKSWDWCVAGDINGDLKADVECKIKGSKKFSRVDGSTGEMLAAEADAAEIVDPKVPGLSADDAAKIDAEKTWDLDGDGEAGESLFVDGNNLAIKSRNKKTPVLAQLDLGGVPLGALVKDLDGDKKPEVIAMSSKTVAIWSAADKEPRTFALTASKYKRQPVAELESVYANGFEDDAAAKKVVDDLNDKLASCYSAQVKKNQFAGVGRALLEVKVSDAAKVTGVETHHTSLADKAVVKCAAGVLKGGKYPKAGGDSASVNVTLVYTFRDQ